MIFFKKDRKFYQKKRWIIPISVIALLIAFRIILPTAIKIGLNNYLEDSSPRFKAYVSDVDVKILRGVYTLEGITAKIKKNDKEILSVASASVSLAWRDIFKGNFIADIIVNEADFNYSNDFLPALETQLEEMKKDEDDKPSPVKIARFDLKNSSVHHGLMDP